ncbi:MAG TPA: hypothetical protein VF173_07185 [Thermoanaerobaculia bacterium]|nr:hypothetical protein [Thermoanaerobaculia bacterium]
MKHFPLMRLAVPAALATAAILAAGALIPAPPAPLQVLTAFAMCGALGAAGDRLVRWLCPGFGLLSRAVAAFTFAVALAVVPATWMGHFGVLRPAPFLLWTAAALLLSLLVPAPPRQTPVLDLDAGDRWSRAEWALLLAASGAVALLGLKFLRHYRWMPVGLGPDDESYHLAAVAVWHRFGDLRMIKFSMGDASTTFYPIGGEVWSWALLAPFRDSDILARWAQFPFALFSFAATAAIGRRLGLPLRPALLGALLFAAIRRSFPLLALSAGNDHSASFFTLAAVDGVLALLGQPTAGTAFYAGTALGMLLGTKYTALLFAPTLLGVLALGALARWLRSTPAERLPLRALAGLALLLAASAAMAGSYTYLRNWVTAGNPVFPAPVSLFGRQILPGLEGATLAARRQAPWFQIDVWKFLTDRRDLLGSFFPFTLLPAAILAPLVALWRRPSRDYRVALVLALPAAFFLEFLYLMHDHRDMRYFLPGVALAAVAFAWVLEQAGPRIAPSVRLLLLLFLTFHVTRKLDLPGLVEAVVALALIGLGWAAVRWGPRLAPPLTQPTSRRWLAAGAAAVIALATLPLGAAVTKYQRVKMEFRPPVVALERMAGPAGAVVAYAGLNKPYTFFGSRLQNDVRIVPRNGDLEDQYYRWGGTVAFPFPADGDYVPWRRRLDWLDVSFVVVHRSPWEDPERDWMEGRPRAFRLAYFDQETEVWQVVPENVRFRQLREADSREPGTTEGDPAPTPAPGSGSNSSRR